MDIIRYAITRPVAVISAVLLVVLFGLVALNRIPIQLAPDVSRPVITVQTNWAGALRSTSNGILSIGKKRPFQVSTI